MIHSTSVSTLELDSVYYLIKNKILGSQRYTYSSHKGNLHLSSTVKDSSTVTIAP